MTDPGTGRGAGRRPPPCNGRAAPGLILETGGRDDRVVRLLPPLNVTAEVVDRACDILLAAIEDACPRKPGEGAASRRARARRGGGDRRAPAHAGVASGRGGGGRGHRATARV
ncbi:hypothetical protein NKH77_01855 [Streptomyces sp. M19]